MNYKTANDSIQIYIYIDALELINIIKRLGLRCIVYNPHKQRNTDKADYKTVTYFLVTITLQLTVIVIIVNATRLRQKDREEDLN